MRKSEFVAKVAKVAGRTHDETESVINAMEPVLSEVVIKGGEEVNLGFGKFKQKHNNAKQGINPLTKKKMDKPATNTLAFKPSKSIKQEA